MSAALETSATSGQCIKPAWVATLHLFYQDAQVLHPNITTSGKELKQTILDKMRALVTTLISEGMRMRMWWSHPQTLHKNGSWSCASTYNATFIARPVIHQQMEQQSVLLVAASWQGPWEAADLLWILWLSVVNNESSGKHELTLLTRWLSSTVGPLTWFGLTLDHRQVKAQNWFCHLMQKCKIFRWLFSKDRK